MSNLKQAIKQNYLKCAKDPSHFINEFCVIQHPQRGKIKFKLYPYQFDVLKEYQENDYKCCFEIKTTWYIYIECCLFLMDDVISCR